MAAKKTVAKNEPAAVGDKKAALETVISRIERDCGKGSIMRLGEVSNMNVEAVSTGSLSLDLALGVGGIPKGRITEIYGPESSGKTTVALHVVAEVQKAGGEAAFIDAEHALDPVYAKHLGVDTNNLLISQPDCGEQALEIAEALVNSGAIDIIVVDSVAALVPKQEIDGEMGASHVGVQARLMSQAMRKLSGAIAKSNCIVIFINQLREKVGVMYGNPEVTTGGKALKYYASVRIDIRKTESLKNGAEVYGNRVKCKVVKNKVAPPFKIAEFDFLYGKGISKGSEALDLAVGYGIIEKSGSWFSFEGQRIGQGKDNARIYLESEPEVLKRVQDAVRAAAAKSDPEEEFDAGEEEFDLRDFEVADENN
ncbi:MAG: recombinase RecA [Clostridia bacterium]|nr:recombinase RecA [Clostridia bacterium]